MVALELHPIPLPPSADVQKLARFGREVRGLNAEHLKDEELQAIEKALYEHGLLLFRNVSLSPAAQYRIVKHFDPGTECYGHGMRRSDRKSECNRKTLFSVKNIPAVPQVLVIGHGTIVEHEGVSEVTLQHPSHRSFHRHPLTDEEEDAGYTRFYHWHMDAALYGFNPPKVTALYGIKVPTGPKQIVRYDDGSDEILPVPLGTTAFTSGHLMFDVLPSELKSVAVRSRVKYAPHPFLWMSPARVHSTGLVLESEGLEVPHDELPHWDESKLKILPMLWKNPLTRNLHLQLAGTAVAEIFINALPEGAERSGCLYPDGAHLTDLKEIRQLLYKLQRPGIKPSLVYPHDWHGKDLVLFHNCGVNHTVVGSFKEDQVRVFHQSNLASPEPPAGPDDEDVKRWA
ncbi:Clavaminate synthase-like protein [Suillus ampliporus]|nr:Clavaminate synthase-like protein [Suillus ampliporus]